MAQFERPTLCLEDRLDQLAQAAKAKAGVLPPGRQRDELLRKARNAEDAKSMDAFLKPQRRLY